MADKRIVFSEGVTQAEGAGLEAPYDLRDGRVRLGVGVEGMPEIESTNEIYGNPSQLPPGYTAFVWKDGYVRARDAATRGDLLYALRNEGITVYGDLDFDGSDGRTAIPHIREVTLGTSVTEDIPPVSGYVGDDGPHRANGLITYLLIPVNTRDEAGPWVEVTWKHGDGGINGGYTDGPQGLPEIGVKCSDEVATILVFCTPEFGEYNQATGLDTPPGSRAFWFLDSFDAVPDEEYDGTYQVTRSFSLYLDGNGEEEASPPDGAIIDRSRVLYAQKQLVIDPDSDSSEPFNLLCSAGVTTSVGSQLQWRLRYKFMWEEPEKITARRIHIDAGVAYYAGVEFDFAPPNYSFWIANPSRPTVNFRKECIASNGESQESSPTTIPGGLGILMTYQGENALLAYNEDDSQRYRYRVNIDGVYESPEQSGIQVSQDSPLITISGFVGAPTVDEPIVEVDTILEPDKLFLSNQNRPLEVTYDQVVIPGGNEVRSIFPARLAEAESLRGYAFYAATEQDIFVVATDNVERSASVDSVAGAQFGQGLNRMDYPALATMATAVAVLGTDNRVYVLSGRQGANQPLFHDEQRPWDTAYDVAYDISSDELVVSTDTGLWRYDVQRQGLYAQQDTSIVDDDHMMQGFDSFVGLFWSLPAGGVGTGAWYRVEGRPDANATLTTPYVVTQPLTPFGQDLNVATLRADYDPVSPGLEQSTDWAVLHHGMRGAGAPSLDDDSAYEYKVPPNVAIYPRLRGRGHQFAMTDFQVLRDINLSIEPG